MQVVDRYENWGNMGREGGGNRIGRAKVRTGVGMGVRKDRGRGQGKRQKKARAQMRKGMGLRTKRGQERGKDNKSHCSE